MDRADIGIIGGSGIGDLLLEQTDGDSVHVETPFGSPSAPPILADWEGVKVAFIARHGQGHRFGPSNVPYRANIWAMKRLGVSAILASGATGSLREDIEPGHLVVCDQVIDRTFRRAGTFFDEGVAVHVELAEPFCPWLRSVIGRAGQGLATTVHHAGTYVCMEGPQFSTRAESNLHRHWGGDLIGMTCMPEAKLAREAEICYAMVALPTDYDCWRPHDPAKPAEALLSEILRNLQTAADNCLLLVREALRLIRAEPGAAGNGGCHCRDALKLAIWSDRGRIDPVIRKRLDPLIGRYLLADNHGDGE